MPRPLRLIVAALIVVCTSAGAMPGMPASWYEALGLAVPADTTEPLRPAGVDAPGDYRPAAGGTIRPLILLVDFDDKPADTDIHPPLEYGKLIFRANQEPGSFTDYWDEVSYGRINIVGDEDEDVDSAWVRISGQDGDGGQLDYAYFAAGEYGFGEYPNNSQGLVESALAFADSRINFAAYDNDGPDGIPRSQNPEGSDDDGYVDALFIVHAGWGAEQSRSADDIWSCKWSLSDDGGPGAYQTDDGVRVNEFMLVPEELYDGVDDGNELLSTIGVFCHTFAHQLGLPTLYDTTPELADPDSYGVGAWCLLGYGAWTGIVAYPHRVPIPGNCPVHPCAWAKIHMGWTDYTPATQGRNQRHVIYRAESSPPAGATRFLKITVAGPEEYFLLENRQQIGFDRGLSALEFIDPQDTGPLHGLLIWHIDEELINELIDSGRINDNEFHKGVDLEEADGLDDLDGLVNTGDDGDPFPGYYGKRVFGPESNPSSLPYDDSKSTCYIDNISDSDNPMICYITSIRNPLTEGVMCGPDPFRPNVDDHLTFFFEHNLRVTVRIYTLSGDLVRTIGEDEVDEAFGQAAWHGDNDDGNQVATGLYFYTIDSGDYHVGHGKFSLIR